MGVRSFQDSAVSDMADSAPLFIISAVPCELGRHYKNNTYIYHVYQNVADDDPFKE